MKDLNIVLTRAGDLSTPDGVSTYVVNLAASLARYNLDVKIVCGSNIGNIEIRGVSIHTLSESNLNSDTLSRVLLWVTQGAKIIHGIRPDIIHFNGIIPVPFNGGKVVTNHGLYEIPFPNKFYTRILYNLYADYVLCSTSIHKEELEKSLGLESEKIAVISPGIETEVYKNRPFEEREDAILFVNPYFNKNLRTVIRSLKIIRKSVPSVKLYIVGEGSWDYYETCLELAVQLNIRSHVHPLGTLPHEKLRDLLSTVKILVAPSYYESFGYVVLEALCSGTPVIGSDRITEDLLIPEVTGHTTKPDDHNAIAEHAVELLSDPIRWSLFSDNAQKNAERFDNKNFVLKVVALYERVLQGLRD
ncbi:MAG: glycosyltransferase [Candidatus Bathyarchaeota archaeon]|jgi:glycosyltransferase involved in cell wall biosynthesis